MALRQREDLNAPERSCSEFIPTSEPGGDTPAPALDTLADLRRAAQRMYGAQVGAALDQGAALDSQQMRIGIALLQLIRGTILDEARLAKARPPQTPAMIDMATLVSPIEREQSTEAPREQAGDDVTEPDVSDDAARDEGQAPEADAATLDLREDEGTEPEGRDAAPEDQAPLAVAEPLAVYFQPDDDEMDATADAPDGHDGADPDEYDDRAEPARPP
jgi:hypothetical protein